MNDIYRFCNSITVDDMLSLLLKPENGITLDGLENAGYARIDKLRERYSAMMEDSVWERCGDSLQAMEDYVSKCNSGVLLGKHLEEAKEKLKLRYCAEEQSKWMEIQTKPNNVLNLLESFIEKSKKGYYTQHLSEALTLQKQLIMSESERKEQIEFDAFKSEWESICNMDDLDRMEEKILLFIAKYGDAKSSLSRYSEIINSAQSMKQNLADEKVARVDWANIQRSSKIEDFMDFIKLHPTSQIRSKAEARMEELKDPLLNDIRLRPFNYSRLEMSKYISSGILSREDLVGRGILSEDTFHHIITYPSLDLEQNATMPYCPEIPIDTPGNTDVFFFGVPGSGKSCVLGALLALDGKTGFSFDPAGPGGAGFYAMELQRYVMNSLLPAATDLIAPPQLIDASISVNNNGLEETHRLSIIDMPGEKTARFAELDEASVCFDDLGEGAAELFNNGNQKMLFFVIDPNNSLGVVLNNRNVAISQVNVLNRVASLLEKSPELMKKVVSIHIILTKSDTIGDSIDGERLSSIFREQNYDAVLGRLNRLCRKYNINARIDGDNSVHVTPFCLGKFGPGETYKFNGTAAQHLLQVIKNSTGGIVEDSFWDSVKKWFNN